MFKKIRIETIIFIILAVILIAIIATIGYIIDRQQLKVRQAVKREGGGIVQTPFMELEPTTYALPPASTPQEEQQTYPPVQYDSNAQDILLEKFQNRKTLSESDMLAKKQMLKLLPDGNTSGNIYESTNIIIGYVHDPDDLNVEITTTNINLAKTEAVQWFKSHGFSEKAVCDHPVSFYLSSETADLLRGSGIIFNPLPLNCE